jgi:U1 small nuclear ribonucleoprotein
MTQYLPPDLLALFAPRDPIAYAEPLDRPVWEKKPWRYTGIAQYLSLFEDASDTPDPTFPETKKERQERKRTKRFERNNALIEERKVSWDPHNLTNATGDPFKTLFVSRANYDTSESRLKREFDVYGPIKTVRIIYDRETKRPRGYAFVEFEHERDMHGKSS